MRLLPQFLSFGLLATATAQQPLNLWTYDNTGNLLGNSFGVSGSDATYDYIVIGGGNAGLTIASRLAQHTNASTTVAVVEAGGFYELDNGNYSIVPGYCTMGTGSMEDAYNPLVDWGFSTVSQPGAADRQLHYARGKTLGGSSARNFMLYQRPTVGSLQRWAKQVGDASYTFAAMMPFYKRSVHYTPPAEGMYMNSTNTENSDAFSERGGPLEVSFGTTVNALGTWVRKAMIAVGLPQIDGFNSGRLLGSAWGAITVDPSNAHRSSSETSFLRQALNNGSSLKVYKNTLAQEILFSEDMTATGVQVATGGTFGTPNINFTLSARKEVILSAGAFQSPQLLMVSGIGPREELSKFNITVLKDLPGVGQNLQDHTIYGTARRVNFLTSSASANNATLAAAGSTQYLQQGTGPLSLFGPGYYGWEKLPEPYRSNLTNSSRTALSSSFPADWPELEYLPVGAFSGDNKATEPADPLGGHNYATLSAALVAPLSRGNVSLAGPDMSTPPLIDPQWLTHPADAELAVQSVKRTREMFDVLARMGVADSEEYYPGANVTSDADILDFVRSTMYAVYHASCTCKMGQESDDMAVVDAKARVFGTRGLRVVDTSAFPFLPPGHPQSTVYALAEKIAEDVLRA